MERRIHRQVSDISDPQQDDMTAATLLLMELGPQYPSPIHRELMDRSTRICACFVCKAAAGSFECFTPSIQGDRRSCSIGGDITGDNRFYEWMVLVADDLYDTYI